MALGESDIGKVYSYVESIREELEVVKDCLNTFIFIEDYMNDNWANEVGLAQELVTAIRSRNFTIENSIIKKQIAFNNTIENMAEKQREINS